MWLHFCLIVNILLQIIKIKDYIDLSDIFWIIWIKICLNIPYISLYCLYLVFFYLYGSIVLYLILYYSKMSQQEFSFANFCSDRWSYAHHPILIHDNLLINSSHRSFEIFIKLMLNKASFINEIDAFPVTERWCLVK